MGDWLSKGTFVLTDNSSFTRDESIHRLIRERGELFEELRERGEMFEELILEKRGELLQQDIIGRGLSVHDMLEHIRRSKLHDLIDQVPKGVDNHVHLPAMGDRRKLLTALATGNYSAWYCPEQFSIKITRSPGRGYKPFTRGAVDDLLSHVVMPRSSPHHAWTDFEECFGRFDDALYYEPFFRKVFLPLVFRELGDRGLLGVEFRISPCGKLWNFTEDGDRYDDDSGKALVEAVQSEAQRQGIQSAFIVCFNKKWNDDKLNRQAIKYLRLFESRPRDILGFDFIGSEDSGRPLSEFARTVESMRKGSGNRLSLVTHAGETSWNDKVTSPSTGNAQYALEAFEVKRIAHPIAHVKQEPVMERLKRMDVTVEVCIVSNMMLGYVQDVRNHPVASLLSHGIPFVLGTDDPGIQNSSITDEYNLFILSTGEGDWNHDLLFMLHLLGERSINASLFDDDVKRKLRHSHDHSWNTFLDRIMALRSVRAHLDKRRRACDNAELNNIPTRMVGFGGRKREIFAFGMWNALRGNATQRAALAVHGMGGIGKTELVIEFAHSLERTLRWIIRGSSSDNLLKGLEHLTVEIGLARRFGRRDVVLRRLSSCLERRHDWLIIADDLQAGYPSNFGLSKAALQTGLILTTSRDPAVALPDSATISLGPLFLNESVDLILHTTRSTEVSVARRVAKLLHNFPLAVSQVASYIRDNNISLSRYVREFQDRGFALEGSIKISRNYAYTTASLLDAIVLESLPFGEHLLFSMAWLGSDSIEHSLIQDIVCHAGGFNDLDGALGQLQAQSVVRPHGRRKAYYMHSIAQALFRSKLQQTRNPDRVVNNLLSILDNRCIVRGSIDFGSCGHMEAVLTHTIQSTIRVRPSLKARTIRRLGLVEGALVHRWAARAGIALSVSEILVETSKRIVQAKSHDEWTDCFARLVALPPTVFSVRLLVSVILRLHVWAEDTVQAFCADRVRQSDVRDWADVRDVRY